MRMLSIFRSIDGSFRMTVLKIIIIASIIFSLSLPLSAEELKTIKLQPPQLDRGKMLMQALKDRQTSRSFSSKKLPLNVLSNLLWAACGINRPESGKRTAPSAVNWQEIDIYVADQDGVYLYDGKDNSLKPILHKDIRALTGKQSFVADAPINLIYVADLSRMGERSEEEKNFYSAVDTGFISQNVYLYCASEGLSTVVRGAVDRDVLSQVMKLTSKQKVILVQTVGYPKE
jgi:SagB-type dehydrogenase family enzyme